MCEAVPVELDDVGQLPAFKAMAAAPCWEETR